ncbi:MAG: polysaccharide biosynthesis protein [Succiniclasticum sp.]|nr:polysaccharide biosynthesis protein [Succiniclasticum sp.]MCI6222025.1 polysaccharide biosynthesis protein [Selenomonadales bacterium]MDY2870615.1 polysaccharide biosynthesis protein [Succiniclasticum sp.]MDY6304223.1 polysaccharide biosynthesis protein [Succiniclasticum sp.]MDY6345935.1 polysaccharide biosynthesis protein [Succiniclasticum sp.]
MGKDKFLKGALILTAAGFFVKVLGSVNRILLSRMLGGEGIGLYQMAYPVYLLMLSVCSAGVPVAVSILVAEKVAREDYAGAHRIFRVTMALMAGFGLVSALGLYELAGFLVNTGIVRDARVYPALVVLAPAVFFSSIVASFRGYFQGCQQMGPPAVSQILEQFVRVMTMVLLAWWLLPKGLTYAAAGAAFGAVPGGLAGFFVLSWFYRKAAPEWRERISRQTGQAVERTGRIARRLVWLAVPTSCANLLIPMTSAIDMVFVPNALGRAGFGVAEATTLFGYLSGMAQPLLLLAAIPTTSLTLSLVPAVSEAFTLGQTEEIRRKIASALKICLLFIVPAAVGMTILAEPISGCLYGTRKAAPVIANLAPSILFLGVYQVTTGALQGIGKTAVPMWNMFFGAVVKVAAVWYWTSLPWLNIQGAAWAADLNFFVVAALNLYFLRRNGIAFPWAEAGRIACASLLMGAGAAGVLWVLPGAGLAARLCVGMVLSFIIYVGAVAMLGIVTKEECLRLPLIGKVLRKWNARP